jgi:hypothetical protein
MTPHGSAFSQTRPSIKASGAPFRYDRIGSMFDQTRQQRFSNFSIVRETFRGRFAGLHNRFNGLFVGENYQEYQQNMAFSELLRLLRKRVFDRATERNGRRAAHRAGRVIDPIRRTKLVSSATAVRARKARSW